MSLPEPAPTTTAPDCANHARMPSTTVSSSSMTAMSAPPKVGPDDARAGEADCTASSGIARGTRIENRDPRPDAESNSTSWWEQRGEAANDRQTQAHALFTMTLCGVNLIELVEYPLALRRRYAYSGIVDLDRKKGSPAAHRAGGT